MRRSQELRDQYGQDLRPRKVSFAQSPLCLCNHKKSMKNGYRKGGCLFYLGLLPHPWIRKGGQAEQRISSGNSSEHGFAKAEAIIRLQAKPTEERLTLHSAHKFLLHANPLWTPSPLCQACFHRTSSPPFTLSVTYQPLRGGHRNSAFNGSQNFRGGWEAPTSTADRQSERPGPSPAPWAPAGPVLCNSRPRAKQVTSSTSSSGIQPE